MSETSRITKPGLQESALRLSQGYFHHKPVEDCPKGKEYQESSLILKVRLLKAGE